MGNIGHSVLAGHASRSVALLIFVSIPLGNLLCESGNLLALRLGLETHFFNAWFLVVGVLGMCWNSFTTLTQCRKTVPALYPQPPYDNPSLFSHRLSLSHRP